VRAAASAARAAPRRPQPTRTVDVLLDAFAIRLTDGYRAAVPALRRALELLLAPEDSDPGSWPFLFSPRASALVAQELWDADAWHVLARRLVQVARREGALANLRFGLHLTAVADILAGELPAAALAVEEDRRIAEAAGNQPIPYTDAILAAWRGREAEAEELIESSSRYARTRGLGKFIDTAAFARAVLCNGLGRHDAALGAARPAFDHDHIGLGPFVLPELVEAAARTGELEIANRALAWLAERTRATPTAWALGVEARARALVSDDDSAEEHYRESIRRLGETRVRVELARSRLLYGEWLRRERRRTDAREPLRVAYTSFAGMGLEAFAERARRELLASGETVRKRTVETRDDLTAQEAQIARLARDGLSNPEISTRLFISPRTVQYHLRKVFIKLGISSRFELERLLPNEPNRSGRA
jgi:DNA-binding CsgD family transcriptional regulator